MILSILGWLLIGLVAGLLGRFLVPGPDPMGLVATTLLGLAGSLLGGLLYNLATGTPDLLAPAGLIGSTIGAVLLVLATRATARPSTDS